MMSTIDLFFARRLNSMISLWKSNIKILETIFLFPLWHVCQCIFRRKLIQETLLPDSETSFRDEGFWLFRIGKTHHLNIYRGRWSWNDLFFIKNEIQKLLPLELINDFLYVIFYFFICYFLFCIYVLFMHFIMNDFLCFFHSLYGTWFQALHKKKMRETHPLPARFIK